MGEVIPPMGEVCRTSGPTLLDFAIDLLWAKSSANFAIGAIGELRHWNDRRSHFADFAIEAYGEVSAGGVFKPLTFAQKLQFSKESSRGRTSKGVPLLKGGVAKATCGLFPNL